MIPNILVELLTDAIRWAGPSGAIIIVLCVVITYLYRKNTRIQDARVKEASEYANKMVALASEMTGVLSTTATATQTMTQTVSSLRDIMLMKKGH